MVEGQRNFENELESLLREGAEGARQRERSTAAALDGLQENGIVLFGAGNLGRRTLIGLREVGIEPKCFIDNNPSAWGQDLEGIPILSPKTGAERYGQRATFVVTIWRAYATESMLQRIEQLHRLGCRNVIAFLPLYWKFPDCLLPHYMHDLPHLIYEQAERVRQALALMGDDQSRGEYLAQVRFRLLGDFAALSAPVSGDIYFRDELFELGQDEVFVDCGAFDGDSLDLFIRKRAHSFRQAIAFEPDPENFAQLKKRVESLPCGTRERIVLHQAASGKRDEQVLMDVGKGVSSKVGTGTCAVDCVALDSALEGLPVSFIKMDIEGAELATLEGARRIVQKNAPILAISAYHQQSDLWNIPLAIHDINPNYSFHLRPHVLDGWDLVCYAVPYGRRSLHR